MFDPNPKKSAADKAIAGQTTEAVVRAIWAQMYPTLDPVTANAEDASQSAATTLAALICRFDRKAAAREAKGA